MVEQETVVARPAPATQVQQVSFAGEVTVSLFSVVRRLIRGRWLILGCSLLGFGIGLIFAYTTPDFFVATAVFLPPEQAEPTLSPTSLLFPRQDPTDMYLGLLTSRSVADDVIEHTGLMARFKTRSHTEARAMLASMSGFSVSANELMTVAIKSEDPKLSAQIANAYLDALYRLNGSMITSASSHREEFFQQQMREQKEALAKAETDLRRTEEKTGIVLPQGEAEAGLSAIAQLQSQINASETRLSGLRVGATEQNPEVIEARTQLAELRAQLARQQAATGTHKSGAGLASNSELPGLTLEYSRVERELKLREGISDTLTQQYERARLASSDPGPQLQIIDRAIPPERKAGPRKRNFAISGFLFGLAAALAYLLLSQPAIKVYRSYRRHSFEEPGGPRP